MMYILIFLVAVLLSNFENKVLHPKHKLQLNVYFGVPGSGKTTYAAFLARQAAKESIVIRLCRRWPNKFTNWILSGRCFKRSYPVWSNVPISGTFKLDAKKDLGTYMVQDGKLIIDEAGVEFNNRDYKSLPRNVIKFLKYHRHYGMSVDVFSQSHEDMDVTLRRLAQNFYVVRRSAIPFFIVTKRIFRKVGIDEMSHQICDYYSFGLPFLDSRYVFCPPLWRMFDSYDVDSLPEKAWQYWFRADAPCSDSAPDAATSGVFSDGEAPPEK